MGRHNYLHVEPNCPELPSYTRLLAKDQFLQCIHKSSYFTILFHADCVYSSFRVFARFVQNLCIIMCALFVHCFLDVCSLGSELFTVCLGYVQCLFRMCALLVLTACTVHSAYWNIVCGSACTVWSESLHCSYRACSLFVQSVCTICSESMHCSFWVRELFTQSVCTVHSECMHWFFKVCALFVQSAYILRSECMHCQISMWTVHSECVLCLFRVHALLIQCVDCSFRVLALFV
jgi:hypothetical protein